MTTKSILFSLAIFQAVSSAILFEYLYVSPVKVLSKFQSFSSNMWPAGRIPAIAAILEVNTTLLTEGLLEADSKTFLVPSRAGSTTSLKGSANVTPRTGNGLAV